MNVKHLPLHLQKLLGAEKRHKFGVGGNKLKRTEDGIVFASQLECSVYRALCRNLKNGRADISLQPRFELQSKFTNVDGVHRRSVNYVSDFLVGNVKPDRVASSAPVPVGALVIDAKGKATRAFADKQKQFEARYGRLYVIQTVTELGRIPWQQYGIELKREFFL